MQRCRRSTQTSAQVARRSLRTALLPAVHLVRSLSTYSSHSMTLESTATSTTNKRPTGWSYASPDLNVLLTGQLVFNEGDDGQLKEGAQFQLDEGGLYIVS